MKYSEIIKFWFEILSPKQWWVKDASLDAMIKDKYTKLHEAAAAGGLKSWRVTDEGRLAEIIILDQFSRNMFRDTPNAFVFDGQAIDLCKSAIEQDTHKRLTPPKTNFLLMPYMHSESLVEHQIALPLFRDYTGDDTFEFEKRHCAIIERFGRYPHRNQILERQSTPQEIDFLNTPGSRF